MKVFTVTNIVTFTNMSSVSAARFEKIKTRLEDATYDLCTSCLNLIEPYESWTLTSESLIKDDFDIWCAAEEAFLKLTSSQPVPKRTWTDPPPEDFKHIGCRAMWALRIYMDTKSEGDDYLEDVVDLILKQPDWTSHPASCPCKVPNNPWTKPDDVKILDKINVTHSNYCECAGMFRCAQKIARANADAQSLHDADAAVLARDMKKLQEFILLADDIKKQTNAMMKAAAWLEANPEKTLPRTACVCDSRWTHHCSCNRTIDYKVFREDFIATPVAPAAAT